MAHPLNPAQLAAVEHQNGPLLVLAGAGSGKTRVITQRIARLLERGIPAKAIVALTFTNKAAGEMAERVAQVAQERGGLAAKGVTISTFHSFGLSVLTREKAATGGAFTIFDQGDCLATIKEILSRTEAGKRFDASAIMTRISNAKNGFVAADDLKEREGDEYDEITKLVYPRYEAALRNFRAYDFDDLVCGVARLWTERADILERWRERYRYLLVDEYQDTNGAQLQLLRLLCEPHRNICVVGDDDQSIYAWRGADVKNILDFEDHFTGATVIKLEQNYRSRKPILDVANAVISIRIDAKRHQKILFTDLPGGDRVKLAVAPSPEAEATFVAMTLKAAIRDDGRKPKDLAVLYRSNGQSKALEEALREYSVPHRVVGGQQFFERKEVKDVLAYLKLSLNRADEIGLRRVLNYPARGIGETTVERLTLHALAKGWSLWQAVERVDALNDIPSAARDGCSKLEKIVAETRKQLLIDRRPASEVARDLCIRVGIKADIDQSSPSPKIAARRWGNLESLFRTFTKREARETERGNDATREDALAAFLHALTLNFDNDEEAETNLVTLSTLHGSKGLEFDVVCLVGCEEGLLPHARTIEEHITQTNSADVEEERRLFYVGVTRAREILYLSRAKARVVRGKPMPRTPSRFLSDIPLELIDEVDVRADPTVTAEAQNEGANALLAALDALGD